MMATHKFPMSTVSFDLTTSAQPRAFSLPYEVLALSNPGTRVGVIRGVCVIPKGGITAVCGDLPVAIEVEFSEATVVKFLAGFIGVTAGAMAGVDLWPAIAETISHRVSTDLCHSARALACVPGTAPFFAIGAGRFGGSQWSKDHELGHLRGLWCHAARTGEPEACSETDPVMPVGDQPNTVEWLGSWDGLEFVPDKGARIPQSLIIRHPGYAARSAYSAWVERFKEAESAEKHLRSSGKRLAVYSPEGLQYGSLVRVAIERGRLVYVYRDLFGRLHTVPPGNGVRVAEE